jgi:DNA-binding protein YbaB
MVDGELDAAQRWVDGWQATIEAQAERAKAMAARVAGLEIGAVSDNGLVEVVVTSTGALSDLRLDEAVRRQPAADTAAQVLATMRAAQASLARRVAAAVEETVGRDSEVGRAVIDAYARRGVTDG